MMFSCRKMRISSSPRGVRLQTRSMILPRTISNLRKVVRLERVFPTVFSVSRVVQVWPLGVLRQLHQVPTSYRIPARCHQAAVEHQ